MPMLPPFFCRLTSTPMLDYVSPMRKRLTWNEINVGDILADFRPARQQTVHYLVVDSRYGELYCVGHGIQNTGYFILQPLDIEDCDVTLTWFDVNHQFSTWRKKG